MAEYTTGDIRNIALIGHAGSGKTSLAEAILYNSGAISRLGKVDDGTTISDYNEDEIERKISINAGILSFKYGKWHINMIDTPGYADFIAEVIGVLSSVDSAILVIDVSEGIEVGTEKTWSMAEENGLARAIFVNKLDKENINFYSVIDSIRERFGKDCIPVVLPVGTGQSFKEVIDLFDETNAHRLVGDDKVRYEKFKNILIETIAEKDDGLLEKYLEGASLTQNEVKAIFKKAFIAKKIFPIFCGATLIDIGAKEILPYITEVFPGPDEGPLREVRDAKAEKEISLDKEGPFSAFVFKTISDPYVGQLNIFRVFSGNLKSESSFYNVNKKMVERFGQLLTIFGKEQRPLAEAIRGDIAGVAKLKNTGTGDTICDERLQVLFKPLFFPEPAISFSIKPKTRQDEDKISNALHKLTSEDQTFRAHRDEQTKELIISGMGDLHLDIMIDRLKKRFSVDVEIGTPKVAYKETIKKIAKAQGKYKRQSGGRGQYGDAWLQVEPLERGKGFEFVDKIVGGVIPKNYIPSIEKGILEAMSEGVIAGYPVVDIKVTVYDGSYHEVDSSDMAFKIAGAMALRKAALEANPVLLEPIMDVEVIVPDEYMGDITGDLNSRRGRIIGMDVRGKLQVIKAKVPIAEMFKYASELKSMTGGRGSYTMRFSHYDEVPAKIAQTIIARYQATRKEEQDR